MLKYYFKFLLLSVVLIGASAVRADAYENFFRALELDDAAVVGRLLQRGFDVNAPNPQGQPALTLALQRGSLKVADLLLAHPELRADALNAAGESALMMAALHGHLGPMRRLIERGARLDSPTGWTALHYAASGADPGAAALLIERGVPLDPVSPSGMTPLMMAARWGGESVVDLLIARGADASRRHPGGATLVDLARASGRERLAERLGRSAPR
ncbi:MAG: ankyrin repeat domain-containing protein [Ideonella sp.]|nr:ankyrin repeat domain-containing protein [Ideonella sp.]